MLNAVQESTNGLQSPTIVVDGVDVWSASLGTEVVVSEPTQRLPKVGDEFAGFELMEELGRGSFGRVFLAKQRALSDRPVALKVSIGPDAEARNLARLQHTNIMPIHSSHRVGGTVAVCMPFLGRTTLSDVCSSLDQLKCLPFSGSHLVGTLHSRAQTTRSSLNGKTTPQSDFSSSEASSVEPPSSESTLLPILEMLRTMNYVDAVLWIVQRIAEGLDHAHERGIIHRDLKPANILLADDGQPLILDFNLATDAAAAGDRGGGTLPYMSPEQLGLLAGLGGRVDRRSDLYALGVLFARLLTGRYPFPVPASTSNAVVVQMIRDRSGPLPDIRDGNRAISPTVQAIIHKCLAANPDERYPTARALIEDLERHRADLPVLHAANPSLRERAGKWIRRHPKLTSPAVVAAAIAALLLSAGSGISLALLSARRAEVANEAERGRAIVGEFDRLQGTARQYLTSHNGRAELADRGRTVGFQALETLVPSDGGPWLERPEFRHLPAEDKEKLAAQAGELIFLLGQTPNRGRDDRSHWVRLAAAVPDAKATPILLASQRHAAGEFRESIGELEGWTRDHPDQADGWFLLGRALAETGRFEDAYHAYGSAIALRSRFAPGWYFRAVLADKLKKTDPSSGLPQALVDAGRAVELDPDFLEARLVRAQIRVGLRQWPQALVDLNAIIDNSAAPTRALLLRAAVRGKLGDEGGAAADRAEVLKREPRSAADYVARGTARLNREPAAALADYVAAEALDFRNLEAVENQAYVQAELLHQPERAVATLDRLVERNPSSPLVHISRAVYQARCGRFADAVAGAKRALALNPKPDITYRVACVYALAAKSDPKYAAPALKHLAAALKGGFGFDELPTDEDLDPLRNRAEFSRLAELTKHLKDLTAGK